MASDIRIKICGLRDRAGVEAAVEAGAAYLGFNFYEPSPRYAAPDVARELALAVPPGVMKVSLTVDADDETLDRIVRTVPLDMIQLHGSEGPERVAEVKARHGLPVMKALGIAGAADLERIAEYVDVADQLLLDAKPPKGAVLPGGNGVTFDWQLLAGRKFWRKPWMLAGGLTQENVTEAVAATGALQVDLSSAVESAPGVKDPALIRAFCQTVARI